MDPPYPSLDPKFLFDLAMGADDSDSNLRGFDFAALNPGDDLKAGDLIGPYTLVEILGEGGFGSVWKATQSHPVARIVALKIIKPGMDTREVIIRFAQERQALAIMDHPNIARVYDAGMTGAGRPYFVLEWVNGIALTSYCDEKRLTIRRRIELFIQICLAIQHAHQKGVIHRDLKPSNILVTEHDGMPVVRVIDFGVAKATEQMLTVETLHTLVGQVIGTPDYMSPEQADPLWQDIDTRSDVYSLGAVLYELLTGTLPLEAVGFQKVTLEEVLQRIREQNPPLPSSRIASLTLERQATVSDQRAMEMSRLLQVVRGDLDWIVMKCLEKDRHRRYETVSGLATDLQRHLNDEPISARPPSSAYLIGRLIRRHKLPFAAAAAIAVTLIAGIITSTSFYIQAEAKRAEAQQARKEQEQLKTEATAAAAQFQRTATIADYQLATRTFSADPESEKAALGYIARALETDPENHSAAALGLYRMMSRPRMLVGRAKDAAEPLSWKAYCKKEIYGDWVPEDLLLRGTLEIMQTSGNLVKGHPSIQDLAVPGGRWLGKPDYPEGYTAHLQNANHGWQGHLATDKCLDEFELKAGLSPDRRHVLIVNRNGGWSIYRYESSHPLKIGAGVLKGWPTADFSARDTFVYLDNDLLWVGRGSYSIKEGAKNPSCGLWSLASGERVVNTPDDPVTGLIAVGFHPSGSLAAMSTFGRKLILLDLATMKRLPYEKLFPNINGHAWFSTDGLLLSTGKQDDQWGGLLMSACAGHLSVPVHANGWSVGKSFQEGLSYRADSLSTSPELSKEYRWLKAVPEVRCGGITPVILSLRASPNVIQWDEGGDALLWCEDGKSFRTAVLSSLKKPGESRVLHEVESAPVKHFRLDQRHGKLVYTTQAGMGFVRVDEGITAMTGEGFVREENLGKVSINGALGRGCVVQKVGNDDVLRLFDLGEQKVLVGQRAVWKESDAGGETSIRDLEFSPDGMRLLVSGTGRPSLQILSSSFLEVVSEGSFLLKSNEISLFLGSDVAWDRSGRNFARASSGGGCRIYRLEEGSANGGFGLSFAEEGVDAGVCVLTAFLPQGNRYLLSASNESKTVRLCDRELNEVIAEWTFADNIEALEVSPSGDRFAVITKKRLEVHWLPPVDEKVPAWFPGFLRQLSNRGVTTAQQIAALKTLEEHLANAEAEEEVAPRLLESVRWALSDARERPVLPGMKMKQAEQLEYALLQGSDLLQKSILNTLILEGVRSAVIYREAAKHPPEGLSDPGLKKWRDYYAAQADKWKSPVMNETLEGAVPERARIMRLPAGGAVPLDNRDPHWSFEKAKVFVQMSRSLHSKGDNQGALKEVKSGEAILRHLMEQDPKNDEWAAGLADCLHLEGLIFYNSGDSAEAEARFEDAASLQPLLTAHEPPRMTWLVKLSDIQMRLAHIAGRKEDWAKASTRWKAAVGTLERRIALDPNDNGAKFWAADASKHWGLVLGKLGKHSEAIEELRRSLAILDVLASTELLTGTSIDWPEQVRSNLADAERALEQQKSVAD